MLLFSSERLKHVSFVSTGVRTSSWSLSKGQTTYHGWRRWNLSVFQTGIRYVDQLRELFYLFALICQEIYLLVSISRQPQSWASYAGPSQTRCFFIQHVEIPLRRQLLQRSERCLIVSFSAFKFWCIHNNQSKTACMFVVLCHHYGVFWVKSQAFLNEGKTERTKEEICFFQSIFLRTFIRSIFFSFSLWGNSSAPRLEGGPWVVRSKSGCPTQKVN